MTREEEVLARLAAKKFATLVKNENWAFPIPNDWEAMTDEQIRYAISILPNYGIKRRSDWKWERS